MPFQLTDLSRIAEYAKLPEWRLRNKCQEMQLPSELTLTKDQLLFQIAFHKPAPPVTAVLEVTEVQ